MLFQQKKEIPMLSTIIRKLFILLLFTASFCISAYAAPDYQVEDQPWIIEKVMQFDQKGILKQKDNGYLYLEVSKNFIAETLPLIETEGKIVPPSHYKSKKGIGAHISIMYENEQIQNEIWEIHELGQEFTFSVMELRTVKINKSNKLKKLWLIAVSAPELEKLRESYGLSSKLKNHDFHITLGNQIPGKQLQINFQNTYMKVEEAEKQEAA